MCGRGRVLAEPRLSPDGESVAFVVTAGGRGALVVVPSVGGPEVVVTSDPPPPATASYGGGVFDWTPDSGALVYVGGDGRLYEQPVLGGPARVVVEDGPVAAPAVSPDGTRVAYVRHGRHVAVAGLAPGAPWPVRLSEAPDFAFDPVWSPDSQRVAWQEWDIPAMPWDDSRIVVAPADTSRDAGAVAIAVGGEPAAAQQPRFSPDGTAVAFLCDANGWLNLWRADPDGTRAAPLVVEPAEHGGPSWGPGQRSYAWSPDGRHLVFCRNEAGFGRLCLATPSSSGAVAVQALDTGVYSALSWVGDRIAGLRSGARTPDQIVVLDVPPRDLLAEAASRAPRPELPPREPAPAATTLAPGALAPDSDASEPRTLAESLTADAPLPSLGTPKRRIVARGPVAGFESAPLVEPEPVTWEGEAVPGLGTAVHGRLYRADPAGPLLVWAHGGPAGQNQATFNARVAYYLDRGANVLQVDYRGSTGWGRPYTQALRGEWGRLDVADAAAGMRAAASEGWAHPSRMVPIGSSAGGLTVLLLLANHPELCVAGVDLYGVTDLFDLDETTHRFEAHYLRSIVGPLPADASRYVARSPITVASRIMAPLLVLQGSADTVVPEAQSDSLVAAVRDAGGTVEYHVYQGEGHGWHRADVVEDELERTWSFLRRFVVRRR